MDRGRHREVKRPDWTQPLRHFKIRQRRLPHWQWPGSVYLLTFRTNGLELSPAARDIVLAACLSQHGQTIDLHAVVVMPDHVHLILQPLRAEGCADRTQEAPVHDLGCISHSIKSFSAHEINRVLERHGRVWQADRFDRIIRDEAEYREKLEYVRNNPVKRGLADDADAYPWTAFPDAPEATVEEKDA